MIKERLYRYHPEQDDLPRMETLEVEERFRRAMVLDVLEHLKQQDATLAYRRSCREGVSAPIRPVHGILAYRGEAS